MTTPSDQAAIARLHETLELQRHAYLKEPDPSLATRLELNVAERAQYAAAHLEQWMRRDERELEPQLYGSSKAYIEFQPKGVIGNMPAWNFPVDLSVGPLVEMLAAGNRVIIKPSEQTPAVGQLLVEMLGDTFAREQV